MEKFKPEENEGLEVPERQAAELAMTDKGGLEYYMSNLRLTENDIVGKDILDVGSGQEYMFAQDIRRKYPDTNVVSFDYSFDRAPRDEEGTVAVTSDRQKIREKGKDLPKVEGLFTALPFKDNSFDLVVSSGAMPLYLNTSDQIKRSFTDVIRVLRKGGTAHIVGPVAYTKIVSTDPEKPIHETHDKYSYDESKALIEHILKKFKNRIEFEFLPDVKWMKLGKYGPEERTSKAAILVIKKLK